jgi:hypothetical protein
MKHYLVTFRKADGYILRARSMTGAKRFASVTHEPGMGSIWVMDLGNGERWHKPEGSRHWFKVRIEEA